jgi:acetolactate synthase-1/2/3 large subunit
MGIQPGAKPKAGSVKHKYRESAFVSIDPRDASSRNTARNTNETVTQHEGESTARVKRASLPASRPRTGVSSAMRVKAAPPAGRQSVTAAASMVELLCSMGVETFFGVPGGPIIPVFHAILNHPRARLIEARQETHGIFAAMGLYRATNQVSAVAVTAGPGATNVVTGVAAAYLERVPMIVLCGDVPWLSTGRKLLQDTGPYGLGIERMLQGITRAVVRVSKAESAAAQLRAAIEAALDPSSPGPVLVVVSVDWSGARAQMPSLIGSSPHRVVDRPAPTQGELDTIVRAFSAAQRPLVVVGAGCREAAPAVRHLIETLGAPFVTTPQAKGIVPEDHPLSLRTCGMAASFWARNYMRAKPDVALVLGTDLDDVATAGTPPVAPDGTLIHVDTDSSVFGRNFPTAIGAVYDVEAFATALADAARTLDDSRYEGLIRQTKSVSPFDAPGFETDASEPLAPHRVIADLERAAGPHATFVTDIGEHMLFALHYVTATAARRFVIHLGLGSMASGIVSAIGHALGDSKRRVVCICGDGGMQMAGMELLVAIKHRLPIVYAVFNDARYNMVYHGYHHTFDSKAAWDTPFVDFAKWAESLGARGRRIERPGEITAELLNELTLDGPVVLDIRQNADIRIQGDGRIEAVRQMSMIHEEV